MANTRELSQLASLLVVNDETRNIGIGTTNPIAKLDVGGNLNVSGVVTATGGFNIGIQSAGTNVTTGVITALNFVGTGNTFTYNTGTKTVDISIAGGSGGSQVSVGTESPASPSSGNLWYNTNLGRTFIYYNDGDSSQWVDAAPFNIVSDSGGGASVSIGTEAPVGPSSGDLWYNADYARIFIYYDNGINSQWVDAAPFNFGIITSLEGLTVTGILTATSGFSGNLTGNVYSSGVSTFTSGPVLIGTASATGTASQKLQVDGGAYVSGNLGIGTTTPTSKLHVIGDARITGVVTATDFNSTSDISLKDNIQTIVNPLDKIIKLNGVTFNWKENQKPSIGVIAQELEKVLPELVTQGNIKTVNYNGIIGVLIEAVKEQQKQIDELKAIIKNQ